MLYRSILTAAAVLTASGILAPQQIQAATVTGGSNANALNAVINVNGNASSLANQAVATGTAPPKYTKATSVPNYNKTASLGPLAIKVTAANVKDTASSAGLDAKGGLITISGASIDSINTTLSALGKTVLTVSASKLVSNASFATTKAGVTKAVGGTTIGSLTINSPAFGINNVKFPLPATPNNHAPTPSQILYHNKDSSVVIYLNRLTPGPVKAGQVTSIAASAVSLHIKNFKYNPAVTISGDINVATSNAN